MCGVLKESPCPKGGWPKGTYGFSWELKNS
jgi:hypothetical protein